MSTSEAPSGPFARSRVATLAAAVFFLAVLYFSYKLKVTPLFAYEGLTFREPDLLHGIFAVALVLVVAAVLPRQLTRASDYLQWMLFVIAVAPAILLAQIMTALSAGEATRFGMVVTACTILVRLATVKGPQLERFRPGLELTGLAWGLLIGYSVGLYAYLFLTTGVPTHWIDFADVYDVRSEFITETQATLLGYLLPIQYNVVNPIFIARGLFARNWVLLSAGIVGQVAIYLSQGQKGVLLSVVAMLGIMWLYRGNRQITGGHLLFASGVVALGALALDALTNSFTWTALLVRRFLVIPGALTVGYIYVFADRPKTHFFELGFGSSPYGEAPSFIVGRVFLGYEHGNANVNLWGNGYLNAGYPGMLVMAALFVLLLWAMDAATQGLPSAVLGVILFRMAIVLASANIWTALLSHGLLALMVFCAFLPRDGWTPGSGAGHAARGRRPLLLTERSP